MKIEELKKLRTLNATKEMMQKAVENEKKGKGHSYSSNHKVDLYGMYMRCQMLQGILKVAIFLPRDMRKGSNRPKFEIFINADTGEWITREFIKKEEKWRNAKIDMLDMYESWDAEHRAWINPEGNKQLKRTLGVTGDGYQAILKYQLEIRKNDLKEKHRRETGPWDMDMELVPDLPKDFMDWCKKTGIRDNYIFYHFKKGGAKKGYCSHCEKEVDLKEVPKHGTDGICPRCKSQIVYKSMGKIKTLWSGTFFGQIIQPTEEGIVIRYFQMSKGYCGTTYDNPKYHISERERVLFSNGFMNIYSWEDYKHTEFRWCKSKWKSSPGFAGLTYTRNLRRLERKELQKSALALIVRRGSTNGARYYMQESQRPILEKLVKAGMDRLANELLDDGNRYSREIKVDERQSELAKALRIDNARMKRLQDVNGNGRYLMWLQEEKRQNTIWKDEMIQFFVKIKQEPNSFGFLNNKMSYLQIMNYLIKQSELSGESIEQTKITWRDYLEMAKKANMRVEQEQIFKPKNLKEKHASTLALLQKEGIDKQAKEVKKKFKNLEKNLKELGKYELVGDKYCVISPKTVEDIIVEGMTLNHCIHTVDYYFARMNNKEAYLLFLRKIGSEKAPYYTLEVEPGGNIRQKRTTGDNQNEDMKDILPFLRLWQKEMKKRISEEDKELAKKSEKLRKENIENLYKEDKRIWNGPLRGQSLAAVLEQEFMGIDDLAM